jgi:tryptophanyl-tRNA synthetase
VRVLSGVQPSGKLHIGNYFGAIKQFVELQERGDSLYFIADLHALTSIRDGAKLAALTREVAGDYLALGLDPAKAVLFKQSDVPEVCELAWILSTVTPMAMLENAHSYKDKLAHGASPDHGLFAYPVLMAADILIYASDLVPVGKDQKQHLEMTRDMAVAFNRTYAPGFDPQTGKGAILKLPEPLILESTAVVPGTDGKKMSKTYANTIDIFAEEKALKKAVMGIVTDSAPVEAPKDPEANNVFQLLKLVSSPAELAATADEFRRGGTGYGEFKKRLLAKLLEAFGPARERRRELERDPARVDAVLREGAEKARALAAPVMRAVREATGLKR